MRPPLLAALTTLAVAACTVALGPAAVGAPVSDPAPNGTAVEHRLQAPQDKVAPSLAVAEGVITAFVELEAPSALEVADDGGDAAAVEAAEERIEDLAQSVVPEQATSRGDVSAPRRMSVTTNLVAGTVVRGDADEIRALAGSRDVSSVYRVIPKTVTNKGTDVLTRVLETWQDTGRTGDGVRVGLVDTGLDYTHATFGGPGTPGAYAQAYGRNGTGPVREGLYDPAKLLGGYDFAGPRYDADGLEPGTTTVPRPDDNPIEGPVSVGTHGHGTHVTATGFGYGVQPDGSTFRGDYAELTDLTDWQVGPGAAPLAGVYALKVFGDIGTTTELTIQALEWAADPDGDNDFSDHLDILNLSLGSAYTPADDPENLFVDRLTELGVLSIFSAGNGGDVTDIGGTSGNARSGLSVAWSVGATITLDAVEVTGSADPTLLGRHVAQAAQAYTGTDDATAPVTYLGPDVTGCDPLTEHAERVAGSIVYLAWDDAEATRECGSSQRWDHAEAAGAVGVLIGTEEDTFEAPIGGNDALPGAQLTAAATDLLLPAIVAGDVVLRLGPSLEGTSFVADPHRADTISPNSSRGVHGSLGIVKPDVAAPGQLISSAASGTGTGASTRSGSSMAAPHVAGIAALVSEARPGWAPAQVKAVIMNTATHDVHAGRDGTGPALGPARVGAGRVDAHAAVRTTTLAYATQDPALVSATFGIVAVGGETVVQERDVTVHNTGDATVRYATAFDAATTSGGATITASPAQIEVPAGERRTVTVTLTADPTTLAKDLDPTSAPTVELAPDVVVPRDHVSVVSGRLVLTSGDTELRVPVQAAPRLVSDLTAQTVVLTTPGTASAPLTVTGRGVDSGGWTSFAVPQQLVATSPQLPDGGPLTSPSTVAAGDLRYVGFSSTAPQLAAAGYDPRLGTVGIGIATYGEWANLGANGLTIVETDVDGDGELDLQTIVGKYEHGIDVTVAETYDDEGRLRERLPINGVLADVDTTVFDSNVMVVPITLDTLGIAPGQTPTFAVWTWSDTYAGDTGGMLDEVEPFTVDPYQPEYWFDDGTLDALLFAGAAGTSVTGHRTAAATAEASDLLVLHTHNATGSRAQVVDVAAPVAAPTSTTLTVTGGRQVGTQATLTAGVDPPAADGTVTFRRGTTEIATVPVGDGAASTTATLPAGSHTLTATFTPESPEWRQSSSEPVRFAVASASSSVEMRVSDRWTTFGEPTTATVTVSAAAGSPTGVVEVRADGRVLGSADVVVDARRGTAVVHLPQDLPVGAHRLTAVYTGSADVEGSSSREVHARVTPARSEVSIGAQTWTVPPGSRPEITVTVAGEHGAPAPSGTVTVMVGLRRLPPVELGPDGTAQVTLPTVRRRSLVTVLYGGDDAYWPDFEMRTMRVR